MGLFEIFRPRAEQDGMSGQQLAADLVASKEQQQAFREPAREQAAAEQAAKLTQLQAAAEQQYPTAPAPEQTATPEDGQQAA